MEHYSEYARGQRDAIFALSRALGYAFSENMRLAGEGHNDSIEVHVALQLLQSGSHDITPAAFEEYVKEAFDQREAEYDAGRELTTVLQRRPALDNGA